MKKNKSVYNRMILIIMSIFMFLCIFPLILLFISSITDEDALILDGYTIFPRNLSLDAYEYLWRRRISIGRAYGITALVTAIGTTVGLMTTSLIAYPLSRTDLLGRKVFSFIVYFTILYNGGLVPTYLLYTNIINIKNTLLALIVPLILVNGFNVIIMRTYYATNIPIEIIEAARIDAANEFQTYFKIVLPMSTPILATMGLLIGITYWNDWYNGMIFITNPKLFSIQNVLNRIITDAQFLGSLGGNYAASELLQELPGISVRMAIAVIGALPIYILFPFFQKFFVKGIAIGAVKG